MKTENGQDCVLVGGLVPGVGSVGPVGVGLKRVGDLVVGVPGVGVG